MRRRSFLATATAGLTTALSGCSGWLPSGGSGDRSATVAWTADGGAFEFAVAEDLVFLSDDRRVRALDRRDGTPAWTTEVESSALVSDGDRVYAYGPDGVVALDAAAGDRRWSTGAPVWLVDRTDDHLVVFAQDETVTGYDPTSGVPAWQVAYDGGRPYRAGDGLAVVPVADGVAGVDVRAGEVRWRYAGASFPGRPADDDERFYATERSGASSYDIVALDRDDGGARWRWETPSGFPSTVRAGDGTLYVGGTPWDSGENYVAAVSTDGGAGRWTTTFDADAFGDPWLQGHTDDAVVFTAGTGGDDGYRDVGALDRSDGTVRWERTDRYPVATGAECTALIGPGGRLHGVGPDGAERWTASVPAPESGGDVRGTLTRSLGDTVVTGYRDRPTLVEHRVGSGERAWQVGLDHRVLVLLAVTDGGSARAELYALGREGLSAVHVD